MRNKKRIIYLLCLVLIAALGASGGCVRLSADKLARMAEENSSIDGDKKHFAPFTANGIEVRLITETTITAEQAMRLHPEAYALIAGEAAGNGISTSLDDADFCSFAKTYAMYETDDARLMLEIRAFAGFVDYYENRAQNEQILEAVAKFQRHRAEGLMPVNATPTAEGEE